MVVCAAQPQPSYSVSGVIEIEFAARSTIEQSTAGVDNRDRANLQFDFGAPCETIDGRVSPVHFLLDFGPRSTGTRRTDASNFQGRWGAVP